MGKPSMLLAAGLAWLLALGEGAFFLISFVVFSFSLLLLLLFSSAIFVNAGAAARDVFFATFGIFIPIGAS